MKYRISEDQLKRIIETNEEDDLNIEGFGRAIIYLNLPLIEIKPTKESDPELFKTKYTDDGHPIPLRISTIKKGVKLISKLTNQVIAKRKSTEPPGSINQMISAFFTPDGFYIILDCENDPNRICIAEIPKSYVYRWNDTTDDDGEQYVKIFRRYYDDLNRRMTLDVVEDSD